MLVVDHSCSLVFMLVLTWLQLELVY